MKIVKQQAGGAALYCVYPATSNVDKELARLVRSLRQARTPFVVGPDKEDSRLLLRIGPLGPFDEIAFDLEWAQFIQRAL